MSPFFRLASGEAARQLRSRILLLTLATVVAFRLGTTWREMPVWSSALADTSVSALAIGAAVMIVASLAVLRDRDTDVADFLESLPIGRRVRIAAVLSGSVLTACLAAAGAVAVQIVGFLPGSVPIGRFDVLEPLTGVAAAVLMACIGVALTVWLPSPVAAPLAIAFVFWLLLQFPDSWLLPVVPDQHLFVDAPRPPGSHLLYVLALALALSAVALLRDHGGRRSATGVVTTAGVAVAGVVAAVVAAVVTSSSPQATAYAALGDPHRPGDVVATARSTDCVTSRSVRYCALPAFAAWVPSWEAAVRPVLDALPHLERDALPDVVQELPVGSVDTARTGDTAYVPVRWGRNGGEVAYRRALAGQVAALATGLPPAKSTDGRLGCRSEGQARVVVALWLVRQVEDPILPTTEQEYVEDSRGGRQEQVTTSDLGFVSYGQAELDLAEQLAAEPAMAGRIRSNWAVLTSPDTSIEQATALLGVNSRRQSAAAPSSAHSGQEACS